MIKRVYLKVQFGNSLDCEPQKDCETQEGVLVEKEQDNPILSIMWEKCTSNTTNHFQYIREHNPILFAEIAPRACTKQP